MVEKTVKMVDGYTYTLTCVTDECRYTDIIDINGSVNMFWVIVFLGAIFSLGYLFGRFVKGLELIKY